jgi:NADPH:quinone reductase-like Zn-dependent oxidoreductase
MSRDGGQKLTNLSQRSNQEDLVFMKELLEAGKIVPVIDRCYPLSELPEAFRYFGEGHARGKVVITVVHQGK